MLVAQVLAGPKYPKTHDQVLERCIALHSSSPPAGLFEAVPVSQLVSLPPEAFAATTPVTYRFAAALGGLRRLGGER